LDEEWCQKANIRGVKLGGEQILGGGSAAVDGRMIEIAIPKSSAWLNKANPIPMAIGLAGISLFWMF
jgi:hypothetical protein